MKKNFSFSLCALLFLCVLCGEIFAMPTTLFYSANKLYEQGRYEEAAGEYKKILDSGVQSGPLYYNLGNCYFKLGSLGKTILYYEKAKRLMPRDPELIFNYNYVQSLIEDKIEIPKKSFLTKKFLDIAESLTFGKWLGFIIIIWLILGATLTINIFLPYFKKNSRYISIGLLILIAIGISCAITQYRLYSSPTAIIITKETPVRYGPGEGEVEAFLLHEGTMVEIKKFEADWYQVQLPDGKSGWLAKEAVEWI